MARRRPRPHYYINLGLSLLVLAVFGLTGAKVVGISAAATANPYGYADYCALESNTTIIYGWAADPDATSLTQPSVTINAGGRAVTVPTNRAGYRDAQINAWIDQNRAGDPKPGTYGFRAPIAGLYKGNSYTITGTALNEGAGSSVILTINTSGYTDGDSSKPYFAGNVIPQACLASPTPSPNPTPAPVPAPKPSPAPSPAPKTVSGGFGNSSSASSGSPAVPGAPSNAADGTIISGTLAASVVVPADGATGVHLAYGTDPLVLNQSTPDQSVDSNSATIILTGLNAATNYYYQIVRSSNDQSSTSIASPFATLGYVIALHFVDNQNKGIQGISTSINLQKGNKTSDNDGNVSFTNVPTGSHSITYTYKGKKYSKLVTATAETVNPADAASAQVVTVNYTIDIQAVTTASTKPVKKDSSPWGIIIPVCVGIIALVLVVIGYSRRRHRNRYQDYYEDFPSAGLPEYQAPAAPPFEPSLPGFNDSAAPKPETSSHMGESLKDMVLRSMAEEAKKREADTNKSHEDQ